MNTLTINHAEISFSVFGKPQTAGSKRAFVLKNTNRAIVTDDNPKSRDWKNAVASRARECYGGDLLDGPLAVEFVFYLPRPKGHFGSGRNASQIKESAPDYPATKPDVLKLSRAVEDALTGVIWRDDAQIVNESLRKEFGEPARVEVVVRRIPSPSQPQAPRLF